MKQNRPYFFCGIGGSGMLPLALIVRAKGFAVSGSDRARDQERTPEKWEFLRRRGISLFRQDGSGVTDANTIVVTSAAVEETVPDVKAARALGATLMTRAQLLAQLFNAATRSVGVAGTSGKTTTTGMIGWILHAAGRNPTIVNGGVMKNFVTQDAPFAGAVVGGADLFVSEVDESDGSIAHYTPHIAVLNNISLDHKSLDELRGLFRDFVGKAAVTVINLDNEETAAIAARIPARKAIAYSLTNPKADLVVNHLSPMPDGMSFTLREKASGASLPVKLAVPGQHNVANALAALAAARTLDVPLEDAVAAIGGFLGIRRRLEVVGSEADVTVIDDFAHNPDKIAATLETLHAFPGRLLVMFQPHGFSPLRKMKDEFVECFARNLRNDDVLIMPEPVYFGGTVERSVTSDDIVRGVQARGRAAYVFADRAACGGKLLELARAGDRIVVMGARDDTLSQFTAELLARLGRYG